MATYRAIHVKMWGDVKFRRLSAPPPNAQFLWIYLLTGPHTTNIPGLFSAGEAQLAEALDWPLEGFRERFQELFRDGLLEFDWRARLVFIPNAIKHNGPDNPNMVKSWKRTWEDLPECELKMIAYEHFDGFLKRLGEPFAKPFRELLAKPSGIYTKTNTKTNDVAHQPSERPSASVETLFPEESKSESERRKKFIKPTAEEVTVYGQEIGYQIDGQKFFDHYEARGWQYKAGSPMKDWRAAVRTWKRRDEENDGQQQGGSDWRITQSPVKN